MPAFSKLGVAALTAALAATPSTGATVWGGSFKGKTGLGPNEFASSCEVTYKEGGTLLTQCGAP